MPYFNWQGITLQGTIKKGKTFTHHEQDLHDFLLKRDIAVLTIKKRNNPFFERRIGNEQCIDFFRHISVLIKAGVLLPDALISIQEQSNHASFCKVIATLSDKIQAGVSLDRAMAEFPAIFDAPMIQLIAVGQETGKLSLLLDMLVQYLEIKKNFNKQMRSLAFIPLITFTFFLGITGLILIGIIPRFATLFASFNQQLPPLTQWLITLSNALNSWYSIGFLGIFFISIYGFLVYKKSNTGNQHIDSLLLKIPYIADLIRNKNCMFFMRSLSVLTASGIPLTKALSLAKQSITQSILREKIVFIEQAVQSGESLTMSFLQHPDQFFSSDCCALIKVGELSGNLPEMLEHAAKRYQDQLQHSLHIITKLFQPLLIIILGLLITLLVFAVYLPILEFSQCIH